MVADADELGDVILISSSDEELTPSKKRPRSDDESAVPTDGVKRTRIVGNSVSNLATISRDFSARTRSASPKAKGHVEAIRRKGVISTSTSGEHEELKRNLASWRSAGIQHASLSMEPGLFTDTEPALRLPTLTVEGIVSWEDRLRDWVILFLDSNDLTPNDTTPDKVAQHFKSWIKRTNHPINNVKNMKNGLRKYESKNGFSRVLEELSLPCPQLITEKDGSVPASTYDDASQNEDTLNPQSGKIIANSGVVEVRRAASPTITAPYKPNNGGGSELEQQQRYFPSAMDPTDMCILCGKEGHTAAKCSGQCCRFCGKFDHWQFVCPSLKRCGKCRQSGHDESQCAEKLALTHDEGLACAFCQLPDHLEESCTLSWRSYNPNEKTIRQVAFLPSPCSICGSGGHFSANCGARVHASRNPTWSATNLERYIDPHSEERPIENTDGQSNGNSNGINIRGRATRTTHVRYSESEESDVEFLGSHRARKPPQRGNMRLASNIQMPSRNSRNQKQPPLPPGPPPGPPIDQRLAGRSHPPASGRGTRSRGGPPSSLPPKPPSRNPMFAPPPSLQSNTNDRSRGGGGGRGKRGRGRGSRGRGT